MQIINAINTTFSSAKIVEMNDEEFADYICENAVTADKEERGGYILLRGVANGEDFISIQGHAGRTFVISGKLQAA